MTSDTERREVASKPRGLDEHIDGVLSMCSPQVRNAMALGAILPARPCLVDGERCLFHGAYVRQWTHGASPLIGGFPAGQESRLVAVVEGEDGTLREVLASRVCLLDSEASFGKYCWGDARVSGLKSSDDERTNRDSQ